MVSMASGAHSPASCVRLVMPAGAVGVRACLVVSRRLSVFLSEPRDVCRSVGVALAAS